MEPFSTMKHIILKKYTFNGWMFLFLDISIFWKFSLLLENEALWNHRHCFMDSKGSMEPILVITDLVK